MILSKTVGFHMIVNKQCMHMNNIHNNRKEYASFRNLFKLDDPDVVLALEMTRHAGCPLVNVVHILVADDTDALGRVMRVHRKVFPHPTPLLPCSICPGFISNISV